MCPGENCGWAWKGDLDKGTEGLKCQTEEREDPSVISEQRTECEG